MKKFFIVPIIIVVVCSLIFSGCAKPAPTPSFVITTDSVQVSEDQEGVINRFGYPDTFVLVMHENTRLEIWNYYTMERSFTFLDGEFANDEFVAELGEGFSFPEFRPTQFNQNMTFDQAKQILGEPTAQGELIPELVELIPELMENTIIYDFHDQVKVAVKDGGVTYVQTLPVAVKK